MSEFSNNWPGGANEDFQNEEFETRSYRFVILGGGNSAGYCAKTLAECLDKKANPLGINIDAVTALSPNTGLCCIISAEPALPYERPALSKAYLHPPGSKTIARLPNFNTCLGSGGKTQTAEFYKNNKIDLLTEHEAIEVDIEKQLIYVDRKSDRKIIEIKYEKLIIATGARPLFTNMFEKSDILSNIFVLRNEFDAKLIIESLTQQTENKDNVNVLIIGGGYIGMELTAAISGWKNTQILAVFPEPFLLQRVFTEEISTWYERKLSEMGNVKILKNSKVMKFIGKDGNVSQAVLENGEQIDVDIALVGIGAVLNTDLFQDQLQFAPKAIRGIAVDENLKTSDPNCFAVGDIAAVPSYRSLKRFEHVDHCRKTAEIAVKNMLLDCQNELFGEKRMPLIIHKYIPFYYSRLFEYTAVPLIFNFYGFNNADTTEYENLDITSFGDFDSLDVKPKGAIWTDKNGFVVGALLIAGTTELFSQLKDIVLKGKRLENLTEASAKKLFNKL